MSKSKSFSPCQIKFGFDIDVRSSIAWPEYFGWDDEFDMIQTYFNKKKLSTLSFLGTDGAGAKLTVIFETVISPEFFIQDYNLAVEYLQHLSDNPIYNRSKQLRENMIEYIQDMDGELDQKKINSDQYLFSVYNKICHGHADYKEHLATIKR